MDRAALKAAKRVGPARRWRQCFRRLEPADLSRFDDGMELGQDDEKRQEPKGKHNTTPGEPVDVQDTRVRTTKVLVRHTTGKGMSMEPHGSGMGTEPTTKLATTDR